MDNEPQRGMIRKADTERPRAGFINRIELRWSTGRQIDGLWVGDFFRSKADDDTRLQRVEQALNLIKLCDPVRYHRLLRDLKRIWVTLVTDGLAEFDEALAACKLDERFVLDDATSVEQIAATIVHEATHARLAGYGIEYDEPIRHRVEAICLRREIAFANKLPNGAEVRELVERTLSLCDDPAYWTGAAFTERYTTGMQQTFRHLGMPSVLIRIAVVTFGWRLAVRGFLRSFRNEQRA